MEKVNIALLGLGNVGRGVWQIINTNKKEIMKHSGYEIVVSKILVRDKDKARGVDVPNKILTTDIDEILNDETIKIVVEVMGGEEPAFSYMLRAMKMKKHVVTANKLVIATLGEELFKTAEEEEIIFNYEASVGGGIPIIREIKESLTANRIEELVGILNGTTNFILSKMTIEGSNFEDTLKEAQDLGYAESDPTSDVEGYDMAYKLAIISSIAFGKKIDVNTFLREGITNIKKVDIDYAKKFGYIIKFLAIGKRKEGKLELRVHPTMIPKEHPLANVNDSFNALFIKGNAVGDLMLYGRGAGDLPTGSAVVSDIISILRNNNLLSSEIETENKLKPKEIQNSGENISEYYIRINSQDKVGVLGEITKIFGENNISILEMTQEVKQLNNVSIVFMTHEAFERDIRKSVEEIERIDSINKVSNIIRIENFK
ncbi:MAG: homoserine dehydrogenase [Clostridiaceae bacterium]